MISMTDLNVIKNNISDIDYDYNYVALRVVNNDYNDYNAQIPNR